MIIIHYIYLLTVISARLLLQVRPTGGLYNQSEVFAFLSYFKGNFRQNLFAEKVGLSS